MASTLSMSWKISKWTPSIVRLLSRGLKTSPSTPIPSPTKEFSFFAARNFSSQLNPDQRIKQIQDYFNQYVEEYYEVTEDDDEELAVKPLREPVPQVTLSTVDDVYNFLVDEKAADIVVLELGDDGPTFFRTLIICSPFNTRHGFAMSDALRRAARIVDEAVSKRSVRNGFGWFQVAIGTIQVHVMSPDLRERFDLEGLWGAGDLEEVNEDGISMLPPKSS